MIKLKKYKYHDKYEKKQTMLDQSGLGKYNILNENSNAFFGNTAPQLCGVKKRLIK